ncbi:STAS domain-containing protein [Streptomyces sp. NPDC057253]|uniref:STAS domain-containing protein n=1 Tax=Streptomyces sp. NPDC057253 TaxID=3346069 RepID=UPI00363838F2
MHDDSPKPVLTASWPPPPGDHGLRYATDGLVLAELHGEMDLATAHRLRCWLDALAALAAPAYVVDLRPVSFVDSTGLNLLLRLRRRVLEAGGTFTVLCAPATRRLLRAHGTLDILNPVATWDEATGARLTPGRPR